MHLKGEFLQRSMKNQQHWAAWGGGKKDDEEQRIPPVSIIYWKGDKVQNCLLCFSHCCLSTRVNKHCKVSRSPYVLYATAAVRGFAWNCGEMKTIPHKFTRKAESPREERIALPAPVPSPSWHHTRLKKKKSTAWFIPTATFSHNVVNLHSVYILQSEGWCWRATLCNYSLWNVGGGRSWNGRCGFVLISWDNEGLAKAAR